MTIKITIGNDDKDKVDVIFYILKDEEKDVMLLKKSGFIMGEIINVGDFDFYNLQANVKKDFSCEYRKYNAWGQRISKTAKVDTVDTDDKIKSIVSC